MIGVVFCSVKPVSSLFSLCGHSFGLLKIFLTRLLSTEFNLYGSVCMIVDVASAVVDVVVVVVDIVVVIVVVVVLFISRVHCSLFINPQTTFPIIVYRLSVVSSLLL